MPFVKRHRTYYKYGTEINADVVGSPTINNGVVSGFSTSNYLKLRNAFNPSSNPWEMGFKFTTGDDVTTQSVVASGLTNQYFNWCIEDGKTQNNVGTGSGWLVMGDSIYGSATILPNTTYWIKVTFDGSVVKLFISTDGKIYNLDWSFSTTQQILSCQVVLGQSRSLSTTNAPNSIDLNESYININGSRWWNGVKAVESTEADYDYYETKNKYYVIAKGAIQKYEKLLDTATAGTYEITVSEESIAKVICVGAGGAAAMRGVYDDKGYGWSGGSGGAFEGTFQLPAGTYKVVVGSANNNTTAQSGNTQTLNPTDTSTHDSYIEGVVRCGGGGSGHYSSNYVGAAGAAPSFTIQPLTTTLSTAGKAGNSGSGGVGSDSAVVVNGGASVYNGYGKGQGCGVSEYAAKRYWINGTGGYVKIEIISKSNHDNKLKFYDVMRTIFHNLTINPTPSDATVTINGNNVNSVTVASGTSISWSVSADGYTAQSGSLTLTDDTTKDVVLEEKNDPLYACYFVSGYTDTYMYAKTPLGSDMLSYFHKNGVYNIPKKSSELTSNSSYSFTSVSEQTAVSNMFGTLTRYTAGDLYS